MEGETDGRGSWCHSVTLCVLFGHIVASALTGCSGNPSGGDASDVSDVSNISDSGHMTDAAADADAGPLMVTMMGTVYGEFVENDDAGMPDVSSPPGRGPRISGATVIFKDQTAGTVAVTTTMADGTFTLMAPADLLGFLQVQPTGRYVGAIRAQKSNEPVYDVVLPLQSGIEGRFAQAGLAYDATKGIITAGFTFTPDGSVSSQPGGEGVRVNAPARHSQPFVLAGNQTVTTDALPPICPSGTSPDAGGDAASLDAGNDAASSDGGPSCVSERLDTVFFPNVTPGLVTLTVVTPAGARCTPRAGITQWLVQPHSFTDLSIDCD